MAALSPLPHGGGPARVGAIMTAPRPTPEAPEIALLRRELAKAEKQSLRLAEARSALPPGSSRARVTSANAKWARAAEYRDLLRRRMDDIEPRAVPSLDNRVGCGFCGESACTFREPRCEKAVEVMERALRNGMPRSGRKA